MQVNIHTAKTQLSKLIKAAQAGERVIIAHDNVPVVEIVPVTPPPKRRFKFGVLEGIVTAVPDFFEPMPEEDLRLWEGRGDDPDPA